MVLGKQHHIAVISSDWEKAREFYIEKLGFQMIREVYRPAQDDYLRMLRLGGIGTDEQQRVNNPEARGLRHLAFRVEDAVAAAAWLNARGIETEPIREDLINGGKFTFFKDPDGLPLEIHE